MYFTSATLALLAVGGANAFNLPKAVANFPEAVESNYNNLIRRKDGAGKCPAVWNQVATELTTMYRDTSVSPAQCNDDARAAIRLAFHVSPRNLTMKPIVCFHQSSNLKLTLS